MSTDTARIIVPLRWRDLDHQGHVFHGTYLSLLDEARTRWLDKNIDDPDSHVIVRMEIDYRTPLTKASDAALTEFRLARIGNTSITIHEWLRGSADDALAVQTVTTLVLWNRTSNTPRAITPDERRRLETHLATSGATNNL